MNKISIRARSVENHKPIIIIVKDDNDVSEYNEYSNASRSCQIFSGMDKGEERELHLQEVLRELQCEKTAVNTAIPVPEVHKESDYSAIYPSDFVCPKNYIRLKTLEFEDESPEYDLDEEDQEWLHKSKLDVTPCKFEKIVEEFEKACSQKALLLEEAKALLRYEASVHLVIAIYDYWLAKRVRMGQLLFLTVKPEKVERSNNIPIDPYIAFRKRSEKMTTRKNRRVDESSYENMLRLQHHMEKLSKIIKAVKRREETKRLMTQTECDIFRKRYEFHDYDKTQLKESEIAMMNKEGQLKLIEDNFKSGQRSREENHKESPCKKPSLNFSDSSKKPPTPPLVTYQHDIDFTFRPMFGCKYFPIRCDLEHQSHSAPVSSPLKTPSYNWRGSQRLHTLQQQYLYCGLPLLDSPPLTPPSPKPVMHHQHPPLHAPPSAFTYQHNNNPTDPKTVPIIDAPRRSQSTFIREDLSLITTNDSMKRPPPQQTKGVIKEHIKVDRRASYPKGVGLTCLQSLTNRRFDGHIGNNHNRHHNKKRAWSSDGVLRTPVVVIATSVNEIA